jgi:hypothetical protein
VLVGVAVVVGNEDMGIAGADGWWKMAGTDAR